MVLYQHRESTEINVCQLLQHFLWILCFKSYYSYIKGMVHPMNIVIIYSPSRRTFLVLIDFLTVFSSSLFYGSQWVQKLLGYQHCSKYLPLFSTEERTSQVWNNLRASDESRICSNSVISIFQQQYIHILQS